LLAISQIGINEQTGESGKKLPVFRKISIVRKIHSSPAIAQVSTRWRDDFFLVWPLPGR
jgi:hypothetical protein